MRFSAGSIHLWRSILIIGPVLAIAIAMHGVWRIQSEGGRPNRDGLSNIAERVARLVEAYVARTVTITGIIAASPSVNDAAAHASAVPRDDGAVTTDDEDWTKRTPRGLGLQKQIDDHPASLFFKYVTDAPGSAYREILVADALGRLVAASNRTDDLDQRNDAWWLVDLDHTPPSCRQATTACVTILDVQLDTSTGFYGFEVIVPILSPAGKPVGVLKAVIDPAELNELLGLTNLSPSHRVSLIRRDGSPVLAITPGPAPATVTARIDGLGDVAEGAEAMLPLAGPDRGFAHVRRLTGVIGREWYVAVTDSGDARPGSWRLFLFWTGLALGMFVVAASAFGIRPARTTNGRRLGVVQ